MKTNDNTAAQLLLFPYQAATPEEIMQNDNIDFLYNQLRLALTELINNVHIRNKDPEIYKENLLQFNELAREWGRPELHP